MLIIIGCFIVNDTLNIYRQWVSGCKKLPLEKNIWLSGPLLGKGVQLIR